MFRQTVIAAVAVAAFVTSAVFAQTQEWEKATPYYEDDAWYDVSEWLDGNDYNPTDEAFGRWDDEAYDKYDSDTSSDVDNDDSATAAKQTAYAAKQATNSDNRATGAAGRDRYGYRDDTLANDRWFYDYWDNGYWLYDDQDSYDVAHYYFDYDHDGLYDSYTSYYDWNQDGVYDDTYRHTFFTLSSDQGKQGSTESNNRQASQQSDASSDKPIAQQSVTGQVQNKKMVAVRGNDHVVVQLKSQDGRQIVADLGLKSKLQDVDISQDDQITVAGRTSKAGEKLILVAHSVTIGDKKHEIDRQPRRFEGTIVETRPVKIRGQEHTLAVVNLKDGKQRLIDLGRSDALAKLNLTKDAHVIVRGVPIKVKDQQMVMGHTVEARGQKVSVNRRSQSDTT